nr:peptidyl-prolyl cis-trans isomerase-like 4 [Quercus suber]
MEVMVIYVFYVAVSALLEASRKETKVSSHKSMQEEVLPAQYGEIVDVNLVRDKGTGKSKGFAFVAYEDQRSTNLAVDNLKGAQVLGWIIRVDHVSSYKKKEEEDEEAEQKKREERGVCRAFQRGECTRGAGCKFSHDEQVIDCKLGNLGLQILFLPNQLLEYESNDNEYESKSRDPKREEKRPRRHEDDEFHGSREKLMIEEKRSRRYNADEFEPNSREDGREENTSRRQESILSGRKVR